MGKIIDYLGNLIRNHVKEHGIVVWFDPEKHYQGILDKFNIGEAKLYAYQDSFFELRAKIDDLLEGDEPPKILVYVPMDRDKTENALIELEKAGAILNPGHTSINQNTRLEVIARAVLKPIMPGSTEEICKQIRAGSLTLDEVEKIAEQGEEIASGAIKLIFESSDPVEIALQFITKPELEENILNKNAIPELSLILKANLGFDTGEETILSKMREKLKVYVLIGDFNLAEMPQSLASVALPEKAEHREIVSKIADRWRNDAAYKDSYITESEEIEDKYNISGCNISLELLIDSQIFSTTEEMLINWVCDLIKNNEIQQAASVVQRRKNSFWSRAKEGFLLKWSMIETAVKLLDSAEKVKGEIKAKKRWKPGEIINKYCQEDEPWFRLDAYQRELEHRCERFHLSISEQTPLMEVVIPKARQVYVDTIIDMAELFQDACESEGFDFGNIALQRETFEDNVKPLLGRGKLAYVWVDALRYEMAVELCAGFSDSFESHIKPAIATFPSITSIGMASLLPDAEQAALTNIKGQIGLTIENIPIITRQDRVKYLSENIGKNKFTEVKIENLVKLRKNTREAIAENDFVLVTSQEIDELCEQGNSSLARRLMGEILELIRRGIINLSELGFDTFIITSDHGYVFLEDIEPGNKVDPPGGDTIDLHQRVWIGNGGAKSPSYLRVKEKDINLSGDYELAFPKVIACFKVKGPDNPYFHGGISPQEMVVPVITVRKILEKAYQKTADEFELAMEKPKITNRLFSVRVEWKSPKQQQLIQDKKNQKRVRLTVKYGKDDIGMAVQAVYGYEDGTNDIILDKDKSNYITMMITDENVTKGLVKLQLLDAETMIELKKIEKELDITI